MNVRDGGSWELAQKFLEDQRIEKTDISIEAQNESKNNEGFIQAKYNIPGTWFCT